MVVRTSIRPLSEQQHIIVLLNWEREDRKRVEGEGTGKQNFFSSEAGGKIREKVRKEVSRGGRDRGGREERRID